MTPEERYVDALGTAGGLDNVTGIEAQPLRLSSPHIYMGLTEEPLMERGELEYLCGVIRGITQDNEKADRNVRPGDHGVCRGQGNTTLMRSCNGRMQRGRKKNNQHKNCTDMKKRREPGYREIQGTTQVDDFPGSIGKSKVLEKVIGVAGEIITGDLAETIKEVLVKGYEFAPDEWDHALELAEMDARGNREVSKRWGVDMVSDSRPSKSVRSLSLLYLTLCATLFIVLDSSIEGFEMGEEWVSLVKTLPVAAFVAYFSTRGWRSIRKSIRRGSAIEPPACICGGSIHSLSCFPKALKYQAKTCSIEVYIKIRPCLRRGRHLTMALWNF